MQTLRDIGEAGLIERIKARARRANRSWVAIGIGDDAAVLRPASGKDLVVSADTLVEDVHFRWKTQAAATVGRRALAVNLSDLAAMGARPLGCTLALAAPPELSVQTALSIVEGLVSEAEKWRSPLVGGNVTRARETSLAVTVFGVLPRGRALRRGDVRAGDRLCVTGRLGGAALDWMRAEREGASIRRVPQPRLEAGSRLLATKGHGGCVDLSDGLIRGLEELLKGTGLGAEIEAKAIPRARGLVAGARRLKLDPEVLALTGAEDYELLFALRSRAESTARLAGRLRVPISQIGRVVRAPGIAGVPQAILRHGWEPFAIR